MVVIAAMSLTLFTTLAAMTPGKDAGKDPGKGSGGGYTNLKVLPKNISTKDLNKIMVDEFTDELGVSCAFCHAENKETHRPDYASDEKPEKQIARTMMRMTLNINKKFFMVKHPVIGGDGMAVTCGTCHRGQAHPDPTAAP